jgi:membrane-anchored glycerophosphoryl diester phosphodiesterase (GDPDase)
MIKRSIVKVLLDMLRHSVRGIMLVILILLALFLCWFTFEFIMHVKDWCSHTIFDGTWY